MLFLFIIVLSLYFILQRIKQIYCIILKFCISRIFKKQKNQRRVRVQENSLRTCQNVLSFKGVCVSQASPPFSLKSQDKVLYDHKTELVGGRDLKSDQGGAKWRQERGQDGPPPESEKLRSRSTGCGGGHPQVSP